MSEIKENAGSIWKNDYKKEGDSQPDYKGKINVDGKIKDISLWVNEWESKKFFGVKIQNEYIKPDQAEKSEAQKEDEPKKDTLPF